MDSKHSIAIFFKNGKQVVYTAMDPNTYFDKYDEMDGAGTYGIYHDCSIFHPGMATKIADDYKLLDQQIMAALGTDDYRKAIVETAFKSNYITFYRSKIIFYKSQLENIAEYYGEIDNFKRMEDAIVVHNTN